MDNIIKNNNHDNDNKKTLKNLEDEIENSLNLNNVTINKYKNKLIHLEKYFIDDSYKKEWNKIQRLHKYLDNMLNQRRDLLASILTIITTIFLPLGVIVGYFGMNFKSMGVPSLKKGIFNMPHAQHYIFWLGLISSLLILSGFYLYANI